MSGIAGILAESRPDRALLSAMTRRLAGRGGCDAEPWLSERVALAQTSDGTAAGIPFPLHSADGRLALVADGHLLNAAELREELGEYHDREPENDWELALTAFRLHGADFIHHLLGDFALALWDRETGKLLLARDYAGARPLCFARTPYGLAFASQARGLLPVLGGSAIEPRALARFLQGGHIAGELTLFAGIEQVPPGSAVIFDADGAVMRRETRARKGQRQRISEADSAKECAALARRIVADTRPSGLLLDGAPSALLLAFATGEAQPQRVWLVRDKSAAQPDPAWLEHWPGTIETVNVDAADLIWRLPEAAWACEEPVWDPRLPARLALAEAAAAHDEWLLCGDGAAETLGGAARYHRPRPQRWLDRLLHPESGGLPGPGIFQGLERQLFGPRLHRASVDWRQPWELAWSAHRERAEIARQQAMDIDLRAPGRTLAVLDRVGMACGVRMRAPWLDERMIDFGLSLPDKLKTLRRGGYLRRRLAESGRDRTPPPPLPPVPLTAWLSGETLNRFEAVLSATPALRFWFHSGTVRELVTMKREGKQVTGMLGTLLMFALWHRIWIEGDGERPPRCDPLDFLG